MLRILFSELRTGEKGPAIFLDRDGVINRRRPDDYVLNWSQFEFMPGIREALKQLSSLRVPMIVISNQAAVGKGLLTSTGLEEITVRMNKELLADGTSLAAAYYCPHRSDENCPCRKPKPGLLARAASDFDIDLSRSIFIGDSDSDAQAARTAGCASVIFGADASLGRTSKSQDPTVIESVDLYPVVSKCIQI